MRNPPDLARLLVDIESDRSVEHWIELNRHEVCARMGAILTQGGAAR